jgi:molecular chaperone GrpE
VAENKEDYSEESQKEVQDENEEKVWEVPDIGEEEKSEIIEEAKESETKADAPVEEAETKTDTLAEENEKHKKEIAGLNDKYLRLYAEFENYKRVVAKEKEELIKYSNEDLLKNLLPVIDHLELAIHHSENDKDNSASALIEGVEMTLKELRNTLEKSGLVGIEALGKPFDPFVHHAMSQVETEESEENTVVMELRKGYMLKDRVLRPAYVGVSKKPSKNEKTEKNKKTSKTKKHKAEKEHNKKEHQKSEIEEE